MTDTNQRKPRFAPLKDGTAFSDRLRMSRFASAHTYEALGFATQAFQHAEKTMLWLARLDEVENMLLEQDNYSPEGGDAARADRAYRQRVMQRMAEIMEAVKGMRSKQVQNSAGVEEELERAYKAAVPAIPKKKKAAKKPEEAPETSSVVMPGVKLDPEKLAAATAAILNRENTRKKLASATIAAIRSRKDAQTTPAKQ